MKKIAKSMANFEMIREDDYIYVDKTKFLYEIISTDIYYFLSRPRRFGKSLTISTLQAIFEGKKELFKGLYIENADWKWEQYPIIRLDYNLIEHGTTEILDNSLRKALKKIGDQHSLILDDTSVGYMFYSLAEQLTEKYNQKVVVLIDEYDKPIISHLGFGKERFLVARNNQEFLKVFYDKFKPLETLFKTVFVTGVCKFSKISIFSTWNNLIELDSIPYFAGFLGYSEQELRNNFHQHFKAMAEKKSIGLKEIYAEFKKYYNGFRFTDEEVYVYNPFSVGNALYSEKIDNYWFESGTPTFLINLMKEKKYDLTKLKYNRMIYDSLKVYDIEDLPIEALLFQTGYMTISSYNSDTDIVTITYPNLEVEKGVTNQLMISYTDNKVDLTLAAELSVFLKKEDYEGFIQNLKKIFASIPYTIVPKYSKEAEVDQVTGLTRFETYYHTIFFLASSLLSNYNNDIFTEFITNKGRLDMLALLKDKIVIFEFKVNQSAEKAIRQIKEKKYADRFKTGDKRVILVGIDFSSEDRNIREYRVEEI